MKIIIDTREQRPYDFDAFPGADTIRAALPTGDYSIVGFEDRIAIERKSLADLIGCLTYERERFQRELERARDLDVFAVVVESTFEAIAKGRYRSRMNPHAACQSIFSFHARHGVPFVFAGSRAAGEYATHSLLFQYLRTVPYRFSGHEDLAVAAAVAPENPCTSSRINS